MGWVSLRLFFSCAGSFLSSPHFHFFSTMLLLSFILTITLPLIGLAFSISSSSQQGSTLSVSSSEAPLLGRPICSYDTITINPSGNNDEDSTSAGPPRQLVSIEDLTPAIQSLLTSSNMRHGVIHVISKHTTTAITINEYEITKRHGQLLFEHLSTR